MTERYAVPADLMERVDRVLKFYAAYGSWHYSERELRAPPRACSAQDDTRPLALIDQGRAAGVVYAELVKLYPLPKTSASESPKAAGWIATHESGKVLHLAQHDGWRVEVALTNEPLPTPLLMFCPRCREQHVDRSTADWANPPHATHKCEHCGLLWRPSNHHTTGVAHLEATEEQHVERIAAAFPYRYELPYEQLARSYAKTSYSAAGPRRRWRVRDEQGEDLIDFWRSRAPHSNEVLAAEIIEQLERELAEAVAKRDEWYVRWETEVKASKAAGPAA